MASTFDDKHYTLHFTCNYSTTIPCHPKSEDVGKTYEIDKSCPQCLPHPYLVNVILDQAHFDKVQALKKKIAASATSSTGSQGQDQISKFLTVNDGNMSVSGGSVSMNKSTTKSSLRAGLHKLKQVVKREKKTPAQAEEAVFAHNVKVSPSTERVEKISVQGSEVAHSRDTTENVSVQAARETAFVDRIPKQIELTTTCPMPAFKEDQGELDAMECDFQTHQQRSVSEKAEKTEKEVEKPRQDAEWESFLEKAKALQERQERERDDATKKKDIEQRLEEAEREVAMAKVVAIEKSLLQLSWIVGDSWYTNAFVMTGFIQEE